MKVEMDFIISKWSEWDKCISESIIKFKAFYGFCPEILQANEHSFSQFDFLTNNNQKENAKKEKTTNDFLLHDEKTEWITLGSFTNGFCSVDFSTNNKLKDKSFRLIYDSDAEWENTEEPPISHISKTIKTLI